MMLRSYELGRFEANKYRSEWKENSSTDVDHLRNIASYMRGPILGAVKSRGGLQRTIYFQVLNYSLVYTEWVSDWCICRHVNIRLDGKILIDRSLCSVQNKWMSKHWRRISQWHLLLEISEIMMPILKYRREWRRRHSWCAHDVKLKLLDRPPPYQLIPRSFLYLLLITRDSTLCFSEHDHAYMYSMQCTPKLLQRKLVL